MLSTSLLAFTIAAQVFAEPIGTGPSISTRSPDGLLDGIYIYRELAPGYNLELPTTLFPLIRGLTDEERRLNLEDDLGSAIDTILIANGVSQRVRFRVLRLLPMSYYMCVYDGDTSITDRCQ